MATDKASAERSFERFLTGESRFCLIEGTAQMGKLGVVMKGLMTKHPEIDSFLASLVNYLTLLRTVTFGAAERELARALPIPAFRAKARQNHGLRVAGLNVHVDTFDARTWVATPDRVHYAIVYLPERLSSAKAVDCMADIMERKPAKVIFCTLADTIKADLAWVHALGPTRITYHLKDEDAAGHAEALTWCKPESYFTENQ